jgi:sugar phosphate isomerase/epimerase
MMDELDEINELHELLKLKHLHMSDVFEELKRIRSKLLYGDEPAYVVEDMVQELIWRVGHYVGEF